MRFDHEPMLGDFGFTYPSMKGSTGYLGHFRLFARIRQVLKILTRSLLLVMYLFFFTVLTLPRGRRDDRLVWVIPTTRLFYFHTEWVNCGQAFRSAALSFFFS